MKPVGYREDFLKTTINKNLTYSQMADRRAQALIAINPILIPLSLTKINHEEFKVPIIIFLETATLTILFSIISQIPKKYDKREHKHCYLFHYSKIVKFKEDKYLDTMREIFSDSSKIADNAIQNMYHVSKYILVPKFRRVRRAYFTFIIVNILVLLLILIHII